MCITSISKLLEKILNHIFRNISPMPEANIFKLIENMFNDKVYVDVENSKNNTFIDIPDFVIDQLIMKVGLKTIAVKNLISIRLGLQDIAKKSINKQKGLASKFLLLFDLKIIGNEKNK